MSFTTLFSPAEQELLASLLYKTGIWVSYAEDEDGAQDDVKEQKALEETIRAAVRHHEEQPLMSEIASACLAQRSEWTRWAQDCFHVPDEAARAIHLLQDKVNRTAADRYGALLLQIGGAVAQAYGEFGADWSEEPEGFFSGLVDKLVHRLESIANEHNSESMNISAGESAALAELENAIRSAKL